VRRAGPLILILLPNLVLAQSPGDSDRHDWSVDITTSVLSDDEATKLSPEAGSEFTRIAFDYVGWIRPTLTVHATVDAIDSGTTGVDVTEAYLQWRRLPRSPRRHQLRVGAFYPPLSLENTAQGWTSPYTQSFSAINTWIGEELRTIGAEWRLSRSLGPRAAQREATLIAASYYGNDPAGALLAWRGFALHSRQTRLDDALLLPAVPQIQPGMMFEKQAPATEPFVETDHAPGFYAGTEWHLGPRLQLTALHYDNHADPTSIRRGHYGWTTRFDHVGLQFDLPARLGLAAQWLDGTTAMGPVVDGAHVVENGYSSYFALLTRRQGRHRWSLRIDRLSMQDLDTTPLDDNSESGRAATVAYQFESNGFWSVGLEYSQLSVRRPAFAYLGGAISQESHVFRFGVRVRLDSTGTNAATRF